MTNNDVLRRLRYIFNYNDDKMIAIFSAADSTVSRETLSNWLKKEEHEDYKNCSDVELATFLNGLINTNRGKKDDKPVQTEKKINNNIIFRKLKIALDLRDDDILEILLLADLRISKHELSAFFRRTNHKHFRACKDQILRNFIRGMQLLYRADSDKNRSEKEGGFKW